MSLEQKIQTLKEDFLDRDQTTFVKIRRTGRLGWESSIPEGTPYSDYMLSPASDEGCWVLESKDGQRIPMTGIMATVPMTRKAKTCKMDKYVTY